MPCNDTKSKVERGEMVLKTLWLVKRVIDWRPSGASAWTSISKLDSDLSNIVMFLFHEKRLFLAAWGQWYLLVFLMINRHDFSLAWNNRVLYGFPIIKCLFFKMNRFKLRVRCRLFSFDFSFHSGNFLFGPKSNIIKALRNFVSSMFLRNVRQAAIMFGLSLPRSKIPCLLSYSYSFTHSFLHLDKLWPL